MANLRPEAGLAAPAAISTSFPIRQSGAFERAASLVAVSFGVCMVQLDVMIVTVALDQIRSLTPGNVSGLQWVVNSYTLAFAGFLLTGGALGDRFGAKRIYTAGLWLFVLASVVCGLAPSGLVLVAARALQGAGAALLLPTSLALIVHAYPHPGERARAIGIWGAAGGLAMAGGPVVGGLLLSAFGWRSIFLVNLPVGLFALALTARFTVPVEGHRGRSLDLLGQILAIVLLIALTATIIEGAPLGWTNPAILVGLTVFVLATAAFLMVEMHGHAPMLPLQLFRHPVFAAATLIGCVNNAAYYGTTFILSLYFRNQLGMSALDTGLAFVPMTGLIAIINVLVGRMAAHTGTRLPIVIGFVMASLGYGAFAWQIGPQAHYADLWWTLLLMGSGTAFVVPPMIAALVGTVERANAGIASGVLNALRQTGGAVGVAVFGVAAGDTSVAGMRVALLIACAAGLAAAAIALVFMPSRKA
ncbi:MFS transporter [Methylovirgula sp. 4M-Z18]|uniref:MFS transporter n=1 Tax=Methylovirgula sp. 4M-Z18 TaxID=2293567 RepID=UPI000E2F6D85|nr:MFS transporter [Methylovirgula sp. 4M-Z18]RFB80079.1 DHA2 family efflux MFS transporter permease subunit [Methylovirgula sp. 4M-Z18]